MSTARHAHRRHRHRPKGPATAQEIQERPENAWLAGDQRSEESVAPPSAVPVPPRPEVAVPISPDATEDKKDHSSLDRKRLVPPGFQAHQPGSEPGFDFLKEEHEAAPSRAKITLVEYSEKRIEMKSFVSAERLGDFLDEEEAIEGLEPATERKAKEGVRWIHVEGIDYEALKVLGLKYELHPLAIEDLTTFPPGIKLDTYPNILFLNLVLATLDDHRYGSGWFAGSGPQPPEELHRFHRLRMWQANAEAFGNFLPRTPSTDLGPGNFPLMYSIRGSRAWQVEDDPRDAMRWCNVALEPVSIFLHSSNTLISVFANEADEVIQPILDRLNSPTTLLRRSQDASFLMESLLDGIIDRLVQVVEEYADELEGMERLVFTRPRQLHTKQLHLILLELHALRRLISPLDSILETLRHIPAQSHNHSLPDRALGFVSRLTRFYLADVADHLRFSLEELTALETRITDLSGLVSNLINHQVNTSMRVLALLSLVFLPLTFVAGVYGMNFQNMPELSWDFGYPFFFIIAACSVGIVVLFFRQLERYIGYRSLS